MKRLLIAVALVAAPAAARAAAIDQVDYFSLSAGQLLDFNTAPAAALPGTSYDSIITPNGVGIAERFYGQTIMNYAGSDKLGDNVIGPLTLVAGAPGQNVDIFQYGSSHVISGLGPVGYPSFDALGEGAISFLFSTDQSQFGFAVFGANQGHATVDFWRADGSLIDSVLIDGVADTYYGFQRGGGAQDIRGVSIWNDDAAGIAFNKIKYDVGSNLVPGAGPPPIDRGPGGAPEPGVWALMLGGFGLAGAALRRRFGAAAAG
jgi:hypothetical protein